MHAISVTGVAGKRPERAFFSVLGGKLSVALNTFGVLRSNVRMPGTQRISAYEELKKV